ncbi:MAG: hypothetical protein ABIW82_11345 [Dokdonella sp.]
MSMWVKLAPLAFCVAVVGAVGAGNREKSDGRASHAPVQKNELMLPSPRSTSPALPCSYDSTAALIVPGASLNADKCVKFGKSDQRNAEILADPSRFASVCATWLTDPPAAYTTACRPKGMPALFDDKARYEMRVDNYGASYWLTIADKALGKLVVPSVELKPFNSSQLGGVAWLQGDDNDHTYYVYFKLDYDSQNNLYKHYGIDVFYKAVTDCDDEKPDVNAVSIKCTDAIVEPGEGDTGGGREGPPK